jgi:tetratricopeptide (TPR) repeat protein
VTDPEHVFDKLLEYAKQLGDSNRFESELRVLIEVLIFCKKSKLEDDIRLSSMGNVSVLLRDMSRYPEAEIFAREMVAESEKLTPIREIHAFAADRLSMALVNQCKYEEALRVSHDAVERFRPVVPEEEAMVLLMEAEADALGGLRRYEEALILTQYCFKTRTNHPERFRDGGHVASKCVFTLAQLFKCVGRLDEAKAVLKNVLGMLKSEGKEVHPAGTLTH